MSLVGKASLATLLVVAVAVGLTIAKGYRSLEAIRDERRSYFVDTLRYEGVEAQSVEAADGGDDSLYMFRDTLYGRWSAEVVGSNVSLRSMVLLDPQELRREFARPEWDVALRGGVAGGSLWAGVGVSRSFGSLTLSLDGGYELFERSPYVGLSASYSLWRE